MTADELRLGFAFAAGVATFFAPCAYPMLPGYVAYFLGEEGGTTAVARAVVVGVAASTGVFAVYVGIVGIVATAGGEALANLSLFGLGVGAVLVVLGGAMALGRGPSFAPRLPRRRRSIGGYVAFGGGYAVAAAGCTAPLFVAVVLSGVGGPVSTLATVAAYAAGMCVLLVGTTVATAIGRRAIIERFAPGGGRLKRLAGALLVVAGFVQVYLYLFRFGGLERLGLA